MKWTAQDIKSVLEAELVKKGSSLEEFEAQLRQRPDSVEKLAMDPLGVFKNLATAGGALTIGGGALAGTGLYAAYLANQNSDNKVLKKMKEQQQYEEATKSLQAAMQNAHQGAI
jgi:hypothetical protein